MITVHPSCLTLPETSTPVRTVSRRYWLLRARCWNSPRRQTRVTMKNNTGIRTVPISFIFIRPPFFHAIRSRISIENVIQFKDAKLQLQISILQEDHFTLFTSLEKSLNRVKSTERSCTNAYTYIYIYSLCNEIEIDTREIPIE